MNDTRSAAEEMRSTTFEHQPLSNTGSDAWRALWAAAERFSTTDAYPDDAFPVTEINARCVLCRQQLREDAVERFRRFHAFLSSQAQRERDEASEVYERLRTQIPNLVVTDETTNEVVEELQLEDPDLGGAVKAFLDGAQHRRVAVMTCLHDASSSVLAIPTIPAEPSS